MSSKSSRDKTKEREREKDRERQARKEKERKERKEKEREKEKRDRKLENRDKIKDREKKVEKDMEKKKSKVRENEKEERRKTEKRTNHKNEPLKEERKSSKEDHVEHHLIEDLIDDDGDLLESEISEENIKPPSRLHQIKSARTTDDQEQEYNYDDDDFEDYDEDFEDDDEEEEEENEISEEDDTRVVEKKLDSGNYDTHISSQASLRMQKELEAVKEAMKRENSGMRTRRTESRFGDSGRESPSPASPVMREERKQSGFINFSAAKQRNKVQIAAAAATSRGSELLQMIRLDIVSFDLLDLPPIR